MSVVSRRFVLKAAAGATAAPVIGAGLSPTPAAAAVAPLFTGHRTDRIFLGLTGGGFSVATLTGPVGLRRTFYQWDGLARELRNIGEDHANRRMPWVSFKPPGATPGSWQAIAAGTHDAAIRVRARAYATLTKPVVVTFNHEPHTDPGPGSDFARAWCRIHDVMKSETGLKNVISAPILGEWVWNPINREDEPEDYYTPEVLSRCHFLGADLYQNSGGHTYAVRLARILSWLDAKGYPDKMVGIGETGATDDFGSPTGAQWWTGSWDWAVSSKRVFGIAYYNNIAGRNWLLTQSTAKLSAFKASLTSASSAYL